MKNIAVLGSTGSIGLSALEVIRHFPEKFRVIALSTNSNIELFERQIKEFRPEFACVSDTAAGKRLKAVKKTKIFFGEGGLEKIVQEKNTQEVLLAISGSAALLPLIKAIEANKQIALANKEALVMAGPIIMNMMVNKKASIIPVDSEQSAIWQCLEGHKSANLKSIYLTASGGPFRKTSKKKLEGISLAEVLKHPKWKMGRKITVDSATLMNKGLELLETMFLFNVQSEKIKILIHPEAIIHSMVEFIDGVVIAQLSATDMRIPIQYALSYPERFANSLPTVDFYKLKELHFEKPDFKKFPCLKLALQVAAELGTKPAVLNAANEVSVREFLNRRINFVDIPRIIERVLGSHRNKLKPDLADIIDADSWARLESYKTIGELS
ncbi:MAG: 1-deoxy-D-xylulose-5-phosphate reductoisomerase [Candidatus Omnitrophota bacterium]